MTFPALREAMSETHPEAPVEETAAAAVPTPESSSPEASTHAEGDAARPSERIRIGTQREGTGEEMPVAKATALPSSVELADKPASRPEAPKVTGKIYPPPNIRDRLSADLEEEFEAALGGESLDTLMDSRPASATIEIPEGTTVTGVVAKIYQDNLFVELGGPKQGVVALKHYEGREIPEVGTELTVTVARSGEDGLYELTPPGGAVEVGNWEDVEEGQVVEVTITGSNKGGLECQVAGLRGFMPMGQISIYRVENPEEYVGQRMNAVVTEANRDRRNLVLSHRGVMEREKAEGRERLMGELAVGQMREGIVRSLRDFGAFVDLGGVDGLIHVSKMSWDRVNHPSEVLQEGQTVKVKIERIDSETGKIGLSYRESAENPWDKVESKYYTGATIKGTVSKTMDFGAFVKLEPGVEGLIHISELAHGRVFRTSDVVSEGQGVEVKVLSVDKEKQRISLSLKALTEAPKKPGQKDDAEETDFTPPPGAPKAPPKRQGNLKGGTSGPSGGEKFGLKW